MVKMNKEVFRAIKDLNRCSSLANKPWAIESDSESGELSFKGVILGTFDSPIWGSIFYFNLQVDPEKLSEPPKIAFSNISYHPYIEPIYRTFCFPPSTFALSSRMNMEHFLDEFVDLFLLKGSISHAINIDAAKNFWESPDKFWSVVRSEANARLKSND